ncbi:hypothetical protein DPMN_066254 [Dreissena polymorpha]|uniref:Uncharacterized protein n=1 Tax=Dreissena polymorpha TaxID=45954 RepID=A0A9D4BSP6_DREPO|nr:hypothetical protein DPMN_066254 [Dreissena polymorpha]
MWCNAVNHKGAGNQGLEYILDNKRRCPRNKKSRLYFSRKNPNVTGSVRRATDPPPTVQTASHVEQTRLIHPQGERILFQNHLK